MKILTFAATNSRQSINKQFAQIALQKMEEEHEITFIDLNDFEMPIYSIDREQADGIPQLAKDFYALISNADALLISFAEHNGSYAVAYKNIFDWTSRFDRNVYQNKPALLLATSPGPSGGSNVLTAAVNSAPHFGMQVVDHVSLPSFYDHVDASNGALNHQDIEQKLTHALSSLQAAVNAATAAA